MGNCGRKRKTDPLRDSRIARSVVESVEKRRKSSRDVRTEMRLNVRDPSVRRRLGSHVIRNE